ncbi:hypothetical protein V8B97DRAFT_1539059 [Scleroderma yunnanense]
MLLKVFDLCTLRNERGLITHMWCLTGRCDPTDFQNFASTLHLFCRSMHDVIKNVRRLCKRQEYEVGRGGVDLKRSRIVLLAVGGKRSIRGCLMNCYANRGVPRQIAKNIMNRNQTQPTYTSTGHRIHTPLTRATRAHLISTEKKVVPVQIIFCFKENK